MSIFESLVANLKSRKAKAALDYKAIVDILTGDGKAPKTEDIEGVLAVSGRSIADLEKDVKSSKRRAGLREQIAMASTLQAERPAIDTAIAKVAAALAKATEIHDAAMKPLRQRIAGINDAAQAASLANMELSRTTPDEFDARREDAEEATRSASRELEAATEHLRAVQGRLSSEDGAETPDASAVVEYQGQVERAEARLQAAQASSDDLVSNQDGMIREMQSA